MLKIFQHHEMIWRHVLKYCIYIKVFSWVTPKKLIFQNDVENKFFSVSIHFNFYWCTFILCHIYDLISYIKAKIINMSSVFIDAGLYIKMRWKLKKITLKEGYSYWHENIILSMYLNFLFLFITSIFHLNILLLILKVNLKYKLKEKYLLDWRIFCIRELLSLTTNVSNIFCESGS